MRTLFTAIFLAILTAAGPAWAKLPVRLPCTPGLQEILDGLRAELLGATRAHPDAVDLAQAVVGSEVFLDPKALDHLPNLQTKAGIWPVQVEFRGQAKGAWKGERPYLFYSKAFGQFAVPPSLLEGNVYSNELFSQRSGLVAGETVQVGQDGAKALSFQVYGEPDGTLLHLSEKQVPTLGTYVRPLDRDHDLIKIRGTFSPDPDNPFTAFTGQGLLVVPKKTIVPLGSVGFDTLLRKLDRLRDKVPLEFKKGETVRFRNSAGEMQTGTWLSQKGILAKIEDASGQILAVDSDEVFKATSQEHVSTPVARAPAENTPAIELKDVTRNTPPAIEDPLRDYYNGAARLSSHPEFKALRPEEQLRAFLRYVQNTILYKGAAGNPVSGLTHLNSVVCSAAGVCRHLAAVLADIYAEAGFQTRLIVDPPVKTEAGHMWLEVTAKLPDGTHQTYIVDPTVQSTDLIIPANEIDHLIRTHPKLPGLKQYASPNRVVVE